MFFFSSSSSAAFFYGNMRRQPYIQQVAATWKTPTECLTTECTYKSQANGTNSRNHSDYFSLFIKSKIIIINPQGRGEKSSTVTINKLTPLSAIFIQGCDWSCKCPETNCFVVVLVHWLLLFISHLTHTHIHIQLPVSHTRCSHWAPSLPWW